MTENYGTSDLYLLASRNNKQPANFVSWLPKLSVWAANPFSFVWKIVLNVLNSDIILLILTAKQL